MTMNDQLHVHQSEATATTAAWRDLVTDYKAKTKYLELAPSTQKALDRTFSVLLGHIEDAGSAEPSEISEHELLAVTGEDYRLCRAARLLIDLAVRKGLRPYGMTLKGVRPFPHRRRVQCTPSEVHQIITAAKADGKPALARLIHVIYGTGIRPAELFRLRYGANFSGGVLRIIQPKTQQLFSVPIQAADSHQAPDGELLFIDNGSDPRSAFRNLKKRHPEIRREIRFEDIANLAVLEMANAGYSLVEIQACTGRLFSWIIGNLDRSIARGGWS